MARTNSEVQHAACSSQNRIGAEVPSDHVSFWVSVGMLFANTCHVFAWGS